MYRFWIIYFLLIRYIYISTYVCPMNFFRTRECGDHYYLGSWDSEIPVILRTAWSRICPSVSNARCSRFSFWKTGKCQKHQETALKTAWSQTSTTWWLKPKNIYKTIKKNFRFPWCKYAICVYCLRNIHDIHKKKHRLKNEKVCSVWIFCFLFYLIFIY